MVADFWGCRLPHSEGQWRSVVQAAVQAMRATLIRLEVHLFEPHGGTAIALLAESHLAIHTWPERDYVAIDAFTCGQRVDPAAGLDVLRREFQPAHERVSQIVRGVFDPSATSGVAYAVDAAAALHEPSLQHGTHGGT